MDNKLKVILDLSADLTTCFNSKICLLKKFTLEYLTALLVVTASLLTTEKLRSLLHHRTCRSPVLQENVLKILSILQYLTMYCYVTAQ